MKRKGREPKECGWNKLTWRMIRVFLFWWIVPYLLLSGVMLHFFIEKNEQQTRSSVLTAMENAGSNIANNMESVIELSRQASYDGVIKKSYEQYLHDKNETAMYRRVMDYLNRTYKYSKEISNTNLLYVRPMTMSYYTYSNVAGATYANIDQFQSNTEEAMRLTAQDLDTKTRFIAIDDHLYVVRNIVLSNFDPFATLVMEVNTNWMFESMNHVIWKESGVVVLDDAVIFADGDAVMDEGDKANVPALEPAVEGRMTSDLDESSQTAYMELKLNGQKFYFINQLDREALLSERSALFAAPVAAGLALIPLLIATFLFFYTNVNKPLDELADASKRIESGEYGVQVTPFNKNQELGQLVDTFNHMSTGLKDSFNRIYAEEIAQRDATLKALQSQINPHFLNNTLEIINWKSRMNGNEDVSRMIEALSVMMNATLNRNSEMFISLAEEMQYVDAYLYIIRERFGSRFCFTTQVPDDLKDCKVPRLIIQPLVENVVEHGGDSLGHVTGGLRVFRAEDKVYIRVENNGRLSLKDREKIEALLQDQEGVTFDRTSIGIRNVHKRLRLLYGEESGLSIFEEDGRTVSQICIQTRTRTA